jgi:hypothetical protein
VAIRTTREIRITSGGFRNSNSFENRGTNSVDSEIQGIQTAEDPNHQVVDSEIVQATKAQVQKTTERRRL